MRRSSVVLIAAASAVVGLAVPAAAAPSKHHHAPMPVSKVRAYADGRKVTLTWADPTGKSFDRVIVRYRRGPDAPRHEHGRYEGHRVRVGRGASSATLSHLRHDTTYGVTVWAVDAHGDRSASRHAHFTTDGTDGGRGRFSARYTDTAGHPLTGVLVSAEPLSGGGGYTTGVSGHDGRITFTLPAGKYLVSAGGTNATGGGSDATGYLPSARFATVRAAHRTAARTVVLGAGGAVRVHVVDKQGRPVTGVTPGVTSVSAYVETDSDFGSSFSTDFQGPGRTDANGDATIKGVFPFQAVQVCASPGPESDATFQAACTSSTLLPRAGEISPVTTLTVTPRRGGRIVGRLGDGTSRGFAESEVEVSRGRNPVAAVTTARSGRFRVAGLRPGTYRVCAIDGSFSNLGRTGYQPGCASHRVTVASTTSTRTTSITLRPGAAATGTVTAPHGVPVPDAYLFLGSGSSPAVAATDSGGHFLAKGLKPGHTHVCVEDVGTSAAKDLPYGAQANCPDNPFSNHRPGPRYAVQQGRIRTGLDVRLRGGAAAKGTVVDGRGRSVPFADVDFVRRKGYDENDSETSADKHGRFRIAGLQNGTYRVCATPLFGEADLHGIDDEFTYTSGDGDCSHHLKVRVEVGHLHRHVRIVVPTTSAVRVTTHDEHGRPVAGVDATVVAACHRFCESATTVFAEPIRIQASAVTDSHGTVLLDGLEPGRYAVCLFAFYGTTRAGSPGTGYADRCSGRTFDVDVRAGRVTGEHLVVSPGGSVSGRVTDASGNPLAGVLVHVSGSAADDLTQDDDPFFADDFGDDDGASAEPAYYSTTAADGTYTVRSVRPGDRLVCADPSAAAGGSSQGGYLPQCVGGTVGSTAKGRPVTVTAGHVSGGVDLTLASGGAITGHVTTKVEHAFDEALLLQSGKVVDDVEVTSSGAYRFAGLVPGTYAVCIDSDSETKRGETERGRCYDDVAWNPARNRPPSDATPVQVTAGLATTGIDVTVPG